jgi:hypothetical protein
LGAKQGGQTAPTSPRTQALLKKEASKGGKKLEDEIQEETAEPVLTKLVMYRADVVRIEKELRDLRDVLADATAKSDSARIQTCASSLAEILCNAVKLLTRGCIDDGDGADGDDEASNAGDVDNSHLYNPRSEVAGGSDGTPLGVLVKMTGEEGAPECRLPLNDTVLLRLADILSCDRDTDNAVELSVCVFMRTALGYYD